MKHSMSRPRPGYSRRCLTPQIASPNLRPRSKPIARIRRAGQPSPRMPHGLILLLILAALPLTACGASVSGGARVQEADASLTSACDRPEQHISAGDWEIMAGRLGDALIECGQKQAALAEYLNDIIGAK